VQARGFSLRKIAAHDIPHQFVGRAVFLPGLAARFRQQLRGHMHDIAVVAGVFIFAAALLASLPQSGAHIRRSASISSYYDGFTDSEGLQNEHGSAFGESTGESVCPTFNSETPELPSCPPKAESPAPRKPLPRFASKPVENYSASYKTPAP